MNQLRLDRKTLSQVTFPESKVSKLVFYAQSFPEKIPSLDNYAVKVPPQNKNRKQRQQTESNRHCLLPLFSAEVSSTYFKTNTCRTERKSKKEEKEETRARTHTHARIHTNTGTRKRTQADQATTHTPPAAPTTPTKPGHTLTSMERPPPPRSEHTMTLQRPGQGQRREENKGHTKWLCQQPEQDKGL